MTGPPPAAGAPAGRGERKAKRMAARRVRRSEARRRAVRGTITVTGELLITLGVVMFLFIGYQLWYTNQTAQRHVEQATQELRERWTDEGPAGHTRPAAFDAGDNFALLYIPRLGLKVPVAEGTDKQRVLDRGLVGHYGAAPLKTAMPWDAEGNFALAGHRASHGEPFRDIGRLKAGDAIVVETRDAYYTYETTSQLPSTSPADVGVLQPVPRGSTFTGPGRYITLTTCTPRYTSTHRLIVWGRLTDERPRADGAPPALTGR
ncbi:class E sortase [Streptomyces vinaceus]|uniref:class E sortase n=1 Tax=Streptomyces vinaceus TaxID=1960 RepID=UPI0038186B03